MSPTKNTDLRMVVDAFSSEHHSWSGDRYRREIDLAYANALMAVVAALDASVPKEYRRIEIAVLRLKVAWLNFKDSGAATPTDEFWILRERLEQASHEREPYVETITELNRQGVAHEQIARMWGLVNDIGIGRAEQIKLELKNPGSVIGADYVHPATAIEQKKLDDERDRLRNELVEIETQPEAPVAAVCPESSKDLYNQAIPIDQASRMLQRSASSIQAEWNGFAKKESEAAKQKQIDKLQKQLAELKS